MIVPVLIIIEGIKKKDLLCHRYEILIEDNTQRDLPCRRYGILQRFKNKIYFPLSYQLLILLKSGGNLYFLPCLLCFLNF